jgi:hypothetical protein
MTEAISQDRERCPFLFCWIKIPMLLRSAWTAAGGRTRAKGSSCRLARAVVGERETYDAVAIRVAPGGGVEEKINNELRTIIKSFRPLRFERLPSGTGSRIR